MFAESAIMWPEMPSPIGHALAGLSAGWIAESTQPRQAGTQSVKALSWLVLATIAVSALPDADLVLPGPHRGWTHGLGTTLFLMIVAGGVTGWVTGRWQWRIVLAIGAAHGSHVLMDWLGIDRLPPFGLQALWPLDDRFYISGWGLFPAVERRLYRPEALRVNLT